MVIDDHSSFSGQVFVIHWLLNNDIYKAIDSVSVMVNKSVVLVLTIIKIVIIA